MRDDLDQPFGRRYADRKDQRGNGDDMTARFRACETLREIGLLAHATYRVPMDKVAAILHHPTAPRAIRAMNLCRAARKHRYEPRSDSLGRTTGRAGTPRMQRKAPWEV